MPTYVYECAKCGDEFELWQSFSEDSLKRHPQCGGKVTKVLQPVGIVLKGSGFYKNDSRSSSGAGSRKRESSPSENGTRDTDSAGTKTESTTKSETKSETTSETKATKPEKKTPAGAGS